MENSTAHETTAVAPSLDVVLPPLLRIDARENGSDIKQVGVPPWRGPAAVGPFKEGRITGFTIAPADDLPPILLLTNSAQPSDGCTHALRLRGAEPDLSAPVLDLTSAKWIKHPEQFPPMADIADYEKQVADSRESWIDVFRYKEENMERNIDGLRPPQLGAIHAVQAHWTVNVDPATVVLPTGVGKTEAMLSILVAERCPRLLVVVPTDALRTQISEKFIFLGLLKTPAFQVVSEQALYPVVGTLNRRLSDIAEVDSFFCKCNVIVTTMPLASQCTPEVMQRMAELCPCLFIDEAHHVAAPTWKGFKDTFAKNRLSNSPPRPSAMTTSRLVVSEFLLSPSGRPKNRVTSSKFNSSPSPSLIPLGKMLQSLRLQWHNSVLTPVTGIF